MASEASLKIPAIHCGACVNTITRILEALPSVEVTQAERVHQRPPGGHGLLPDRPLRRRGVLPSPYVIGA